MTAISSMSSSLYAGYTPGLAADQAPAATPGGAGQVGHASTSTSASSLIVAGGAVQDMGAMFATFQQAMASGDPMRMLAALLILNTLFGKGQEESDPKDTLMGLAGLAMLGQNGGFSLSQSTTVSFAQQSGSTAYGAHTHTSSVTSSLSVIA